MQAKGSQRKELKKQAESMEVQQQQLASQLQEASEELAQEDKA